MEEEMDSSTADQPTEHQPTTASSSQQNTQFNLRTANQLFLQLDGVSNEKIQFIFSNLPRMEVNSSSFVMSTLREVVNGGGHPVDTEEKSFNIVALISRVAEQVCILTDRFASNFRLKLLTSDALSVETISSTFLPGNIICARGLLMSAQDGGQWCANVASVVVNSFTDNASALLLYSQQKINLSEAKAIFQLTVLLGEQFTSFRQDIAPTTESAHASDSGAALVTEAIIFCCTHLLLWCSL